MGHFICLFGILGCLFVSYQCVPLRCLFVPIKTADGRKGTCCLFWDKEFPRSEGTSEIPSQAESSTLDNIYIRNYPKEISTEEIKINYHTEVSTPSDKLPSSVTTQGTDKERPSNQTKTFFRTTPFPKHRVIINSPTKCDPGYFLDINNECVEEF